MSEANATTESGTIRTLTGQVVSDKMDKSITVAVQRQVRHPVYGKYIRLTSKVMAHDEENECRTGDTVSIASCRPLSRRKTYRLVSIIERASR
ncbi:MAG: 30S ribosomal protein S17 [Gammaproteobacteria bacterium]|nr:30S ribosomal protein S17 [Gammaproteobacteria bacterium]NNF61732.1 30S ribosomal protein S17 [Gammaproteobacteria bacterium]NNM20826.1 30S ribosomal protein S17 [Gammaproteobacteria bacterium]